MNDFESLILELQREVDSEKICKFVDIIDELSSVAERYGNTVEEFICLAKTATKTRFCIQSKYIHRGCCCPSPVIDLLVGNTKRGKLTDKLPKTKKEYFKYYYDDTGFVFFAEKYNPGLSVESPVEVEIIVRDNDVEFGITFDSINPTSINYLTKAHYEGQFIKSYSELVYSEYIQKAMMDLHYEEYMYTENQLTKANMYFGIIPSFNIYDLNECFFRYDDNGKIYEYDVLRKSKLSTYSVPKAKYSQRLL